MMTRINIRIDQSSNRNKILSIVKANKVSLNNPFRGLKVSIARVTDDNVDTTITHIVQYDLYLNVCNIY